MQFIVRALTLAITDFALVLIPFLCCHSSVDGRMHAATVLVPRRQMLLSSLSCETCQVHAVDLLHQITLFEETTTCIGSENVPKPETEEACRKILSYLSGTTISWAIKQQRVLVLHVLR